MNNERRKKIAKAVDLIGQARDILEEVLDEEQMCYDNLPEGIQYGDRGMQLQDNIDILDEFIISLDGVDELSDM